MKRLLIIAAAMLLSLVAYSQGNVLVYASRSCVSGETRIELQNVHMDIDTQFTDGKVSFTVFGSNGTERYDYRITKVERGNGFVNYRCNPKGNKEDALLKVYRQTSHYNEYSENGNSCVEFTENFCVLRRRTPYGYLEYRFVF